jgi:ribonuclease BN (tRNA processing enzyme)
MKYGGNTTSLRVHSECLPNGVALAIDAGSGHTALSNDLLKGGVMKVWMLFTHWHHDHTQGLMLAPHTFIPVAEMTVWGPKEHNFGPNEVFADLMKAPHFPVNFARLRHRFNCKPLENIGTQVLAIHPEGGHVLMQHHIYETLLKEGKQITFGKQRFPETECLIVRMLKTTHPEYTVSYRFEERPTGKVFVFLTDHENTDGMPKDLLSHIRSANLLIQDCQYSRKRYEEQTAGFGHGTPDYCVETAAAAGVACLGLTHHDPNASDKDVETRLEEAQKFADKRKLEGLKIFACEDYGEYEVC